MQDKTIGRQTHYSAMNMNFPDGDFLPSQEHRSDEIVADLQKLGFQCNLADNRLIASNKRDFNSEFVSHNQ